MKDHFDTKDIVLLILCIFLPPLAAFIKVGLRLHFWLNLILTMLAWIPGCLHAIYLVVSEQGQEEL